MPLSSYARRLTESLSLTVCDENDLAVSLTVITIVISMTYTVRIIPFGRNRLSIVRAAQSE
jgi:hypothetical protein